MTAPHDETLNRFAEALSDRETSLYELTLIVSGASELSGRAIANAKRFCELHIPGRYRLSVVDLHEEPASVLTVEVLAAPTLVKTWPLPARKFVGDLSHTDKVLVALGLPKRPVEASHGFV